VETYAPDDPGKSGERNLELSQRVTTVRRTGPEGKEVTQEQREERNPAAPTQDLRVTQKTIDIVRIGSGGKSQENRTIQTLDSNGSLGVVWVDMGQTTRAPSIQVDTKKAGSAPPEKAATPPQPKPQ
jgi:hypothetical protein